MVVTILQAFVSHHFQPVAPALASLWGDLTPTTASATIALEYVGNMPPPRAPGAPAYGLLLGFTPHPALPARLAWIGYWSAETCRMLGMTAADPRCSVFHRIRPCAGGGLAFELTAEPLDLTRPEHRAALDAAYEAFPMIHDARRLPSQP